MTSQLIAIISDFGSRDYFNGVMKGVIKTINPRAEFIDISGDAAPFSVPNAQFLLASSFRFFPEGTVFLVVVDPGVGSTRKALVASDGPYRFVLPDNGIISAVFSGNTACHTIDVTPGKDISATFHGRDIFAPAAAKLSLDASLDEFGKPRPNPVLRPYPPYTENGVRLEGEVIHIDRFGNVITSFPASFEETVSRGSIRIKGVKMEKIVITHFDELDNKTVGLYRGSAGLLELAIKQGSLAARKDIHIGDPITVTHDER